MGDWADLRPKVPQHSALAPGSNCEWVMTIFFGRNDLGECPLSRTEISNVNVLGWGAKQIGYGSCRSAASAIIGKPNGFLFIEEYSHIDIESRGNPLEYKNQWIAHPALHSGNVAPVEPAIGCKVFLIDLKLCPEPPNIPANTLADIHRARTIGSSDLYAHDL